MITFEDLRDTVVRFSQDFPQVEAWVHQRGFDEGDLNKWLVHNAIICLQATLTVAPEQLIGTDLESAIQLYRHASLVGLNVGYELGLRHGRELRQ